MQSFTFETHVLYYIFFLLNFLNFRALKDVAWRANSSIEKCVFTLNFLFYYAKFVIALLESYTFMCFYLTDEQWTPFSIKCNHGEQFFYGINDKIYLNGKVSLTTWREMDFHRITSPTIYYLFPFPTFITLICTYYLLYLVSEPWIQ